MLADSLHIPSYKPRSFDAGRIFLFVDETGDPGHPRQRDASRYYQLNVTVAHRTALKHIHKHLAAFRYFKDTGNELKKHTRDAKILSEVYKNLATKDGVSFFSFVLHKETYTGPYLHKYGKNVQQYNPKKFRNFVIRKSFEHIFNELMVIDTQVNNIEVVFDRYLESEDDENNLKQYLRGNYNLPHHEKIVQVDSEYSEAVQVSDCMGRYVKAYCFDEEDKLAVPVFDFIRIFTIEDPDHITEKRPDTPAGTRRSSPM